LLSFLCVLVTLGGLAVPAHGQERQDEIARRLDQIERQRTALEQREELVRDGIERDTVRRALLTDELSELEAVLGEVQGRVDAAQAALGAIQGRIDAHRASITHANALLERGIRDIQQRARHIYKHGPASYLDMFADVEGFGDFVRRVAVIGNVVREDEREIVEVREVRAQIERSLDSLDQLEKEASAQLSVLNVERDRAARVAGAVRGREQAVSGELATSYARLGSIEEQKEQYERETAELEAESFAIEAFLRGRGSGPAKVSPRGMIWPVNGPITSGYGWREHPVLGGRRFHAGIDIGASTGTLIAAAGEGTVIFAGLKNGYGNTVIVDHGGGIATLYAHQSTIGSSVGQAVRRGQTIGYVGCTGYCTGPHLHFEVRVNGEHVDPTGWLPS
jgi:murein DD-endopeptidase MepM/ murein hydrolase activator NlpD